MLRGEKVLIRPMQHEDLEMYYEWITEQKHMGSFMDAQMRYKDMFIENVKKSLTNTKSFYGIIEDVNKQSIGVISYHQAQYSKISLEVGILIAEQGARGKGIGNEAMELFVDYLFNTKPIMRIQFVTRSDNEGMKKLGEKVGFRKEGILRNFMFTQGKNRDYYIAAITREDWNDRRFD